MPGFWMKTEQGNDIHINGDPGMSEETAQALAAVMDAAAKQLADKPSPYQLIGETLVNVGELKKILQTLIDDYTVEKWERDGSLIDVELLSFQAWVNDRYSDKK